MLFRLRGLRSGRDAPIWASMQARGFRLHDPETLTLIGRPWTRGAGLRPDEDFLRFGEPGYAKMAMDLRALPDGEGARLETETRVFLTDAAARRRFARLLARDPALQRPDSTPLAPRREAARRALTRILSGAPAVVLEMATSRASSARAAVDLTFEELYRGHRADVYRAALRELGNVHDAEDVTQAAFADAYRAVLRGTRPQSPRAWLLAISENVRRRRFRTAQRRPREELVVDDADFPPAAELPYEQSRELAEALAALPAEQRRVFVLREIVGLSYAEIADEAGSTVASIQMLLFRARRSLREQLDPPTVAIRRPVFLPPVPSWLAGLFSRVELASLTPRAAGALGATVLAIAGASVAVPIPQAAARDAARTAAAARAAAAEPAAARAEPTPLAGEANRCAAAGRRPCRAEPAPRAADAAGGVVAAGVHAHGCPEYCARSGRGPDTDAERPRCDGGEDTARGCAAAGRAAAGVSCRRCRCRFRFRFPSRLRRCRRRCPTSSRTATGAAGAAGASAPPVPVPAVPLPTLPHAP